MHDLTNKVAVITGAGSGLGREYALACARRGMRIAAADLEYIMTRATNATSDSGTSSSDAR